MRHGLRYSQHFASVGTRTLELGDQELEHSSDARRAASARSTPPREELVLAAGYQG